MFSYIIGEIKIIKKDFIVLENNNIGYKIYMPSRNISSFIKNETVKIFTEFVVREDSVALFGFKDIDELEMFLSLIDISGVGPKAGLSILSTLSVYEIKKAILSNDANLISKAQGIGKKTASRIILELTDKIDISEIDGEYNNVKDNTIVYDDNYEIALEALINLGYIKSDAVKVLSSIELQGLELSQIIKEALKRI